MWTDDPVIRYEEKVRGVEADRASNDVVDDRRRAAFDGIWDDLEACAASKRQALGLTIFPSVLRLDSFSTELRYQKAQKKG